MKYLKYASILIIPFILFFSFIVYMHIVAYNTGLQGFRGGPQDAFRHTLASAYVSRYIGPWAVDAFTKYSEDDLQSNYDLMDWHNNFIGRDVGQTNSPDLYASVLTLVRNGQENAQDSKVIRWLPENKWSPFLGN
jgi:hypothetical protein